MAVQEIYKMGNPKLFESSVPVLEPTSADIRTLLQNMRDTLEYVNGNGLAAPQIGIKKRVVLYRILSQIIPNGAKTPEIPWTPMINPKITALNKKKSDIWERCLSLPGLYGKVPRFNHIKINYKTPFGKKVEEIHQDFVAMLLQHECDHLDGILYPMRMRDIRGLSYLSEISNDGPFYKYSTKEFDGL